MLGNCLIEGKHVVILLLRVHAGCAVQCGSIHNREFQLIITGFQLNEQIQDFIDNFLRTGCRTVNLVHHNDRRQVLLQRFAQNEFRLRHAAFISIYNQQYTVNHLHDPFHFTAEVGVSRGIYNVDQELFIGNCCIFG
ncbi:hypothetical protein D3C75_558890 [compost metagenome]